MSVQLVSRSLGAIILGMMGTIEELEEAADARQEVKFKEYELRARLRDLGKVLRDKDDDTGGQFTGEARLAWLWSRVPISDARGMAELLTFLVDQTCRVDNWSDCVRPRGRKTEDDEIFEAEVVEPIQKAFQVALDACCAAIDELRGSFAEELR